MLRTTAEIFVDVVTFYEESIRIDSGHRDARSTHCSDLIVHKGKQWRDDDSDTMIDHGWKLKAQALPEKRVNFNEQCIREGRNYPNDVAVDNQNVISACDVS